MEAVIDLVERLRSFRKRFVPWGVGDRIQAVETMEKAATEIETLRAQNVALRGSELEVLRYQNEQLRAEVKRWHDFCDQYGIDANPAAMDDFIAANTDGG